MRRLIIPALALGLASCGGDPASPAKTAPVSFTLVNASAPLAGTVGERLPVSLEVQARRAGEPAPGQAVTFVVPDPECGQPVAGSALTDAAGSAREQWELGTTARACTMEVRAVDQTSGAPVLLGTFTATVQPGPLAAFGIHQTSPTVGLLLPTESRTLLVDLVTQARDAYGNEVARPELTAEIESGTATLDAGAFLAGATEGTGRLIVHGGGLTTSTTYTIVQSLAVNPWRIRYACHLPSPNGVPLDSIRVQLLTDSVPYLPPGASPGTAGPIGTIFAHGEETRYNPDGTSVTLAVTERVEILSQVPGRLWTRKFSVPNPPHGPSGVVVDALSERMPGLPAEYVGGSWCMSGSSSGVGQALTLTERPAPPQ